MVFAKNLGVFEHLHSVDRYGNCARVHIPGTEVSRPHNELRVGGSFTNLDDWYLEVDCELASWAAHSVVTISPIKVAIGYSVTLEDPLVEVVWVLNPPRA